MGIIFHGRVGMWHSIEKGPYVRPMIPDPDNTRQQIIEPLSKMTETNKKQYIADVRVVNYILKAIPNDIYNSLDACKTTQEMWERIKRLMYGSNITNHVRHSRLMDEFVKFAPERRNPRISEGQRLDDMSQNYDAKAVSGAKKAFKEQENRYLEDIGDLEEKLSSHDRIVYKMGQSIQTIHILGKTPNKVYDPCQKAGLSYENPERLKRAIAA
ncbi:hypothetical protein Tco_0484228 [Tanacetum coccineum]